MHPRYGLKPVAEGVAGNQPTSKTGEDNIARSLLQDLCEDGRQTVKVTKILRKNTELIYPDDADKLSKLLDDYVAPTATNGPYVPWSTIYLVEKGDED